MDDRDRDRVAVPRVGIVGCGQIGSLLDEARGDGPVLTHAGAYQRSRRVALTSLCDSNAQRLSECGLRRRVAGLHHDYRSMLRSEHLDILSICTPPAQHLEIVEAAVAAGVRTVFCEKPISMNAGDAQQIRRLVAEHGTQVAINYIRRWDPGIQEAAQLVRSAGIGSVQKIVGFYSNGLLNNGSHLIDLLNLLVGLPVSVQSLQSNAASDAADPGLDCILRFKPSEADQFAAYLHCCDHRFFSIFELDILGTNGRLRITDTGRCIEVFAAACDTTFTGYATLQRVRNITSELDRALEHAVEELADLNQGVTAVPACGVAEAIDCLRVVDALRASMRTGSVTELRNF